MINSLIARSGLGFIVVLFCLSFVYPQSYYEGRDYIADGVRQPLVILTSKPEAEILKERWRAIGDEINATDELLPGTFMQNGYRGWYLRWAPNNGFVYIYHMEDLDIIDYSYGKVEVRGQEITFIPEREMREIYRGVKLKTPKVWLALGGNLIPKNKIRAFADYRSGLGDYNNWDCECMAFMGRSVFTKPRRETPKFEVPLQYRSLFREPIQAKVIAVGATKIVREPEMSPQQQLPLTIDAGRNKGIKKGLILRWFVDDYTRRELVITKVYAKTAEGIITDLVSDEEPVPTYYDIETEKQIPFPEIKIGMEFSTKLF